LQVNGEWITDGVVAKFLEEATVKRNRQKDRKRKDLQQLNRQKELKTKRLQELNRQKKRERKLHELNR
jgi:Zn-finger nucleic acid-binding protein